MHGMMLPSGNDAAFTLAKHFGGILLLKKQEYAKVNEVLVEDSSEEASDNEDFSQQCEEVKKDEDVDFFDNTIGV